MKFGSDLTMYTPEIHVKQLPVSLQKISKFDAMPHKFNKNSIALTLFKVDLLDSLETVNA